MAMIKVLILGSLIVMVTPARASSDAAQLAFQARNYSEAIILHAYAVCSGIWKIPTR